MDFVELNLGACVFVPHNEHVWYRGELQRKISNSLFEIKVHKHDNYLFSYDEFTPMTHQLDKKSTGVGSQTFPPQNLDVPNEGADDMSTLGFLHEANILHNIRQRHRLNIPYTYTGDICIAVNPYKWLDLYNVANKFETLINYLS